MDSIAKPYVIGLDLGGTNSVFGIVDTRGEIKGSTAIKTQAYSDVNDYVQAGVDALQPIIDMVGGIEKIKGMGVSACATCDGFFYRKRVVAVVGGGDTACEEATYLASLCSKVYLIVRRDQLRASVAMRERVTSNPKIEILWNTNTKEVLGDSNGVTGIVVENNKSGEQREIALEGFFLAIGHHPNSELFAKYLNLDKEGYIKTEENSSATNIPGVFAAGDVMDPKYRQAIVAAASGCKAAMDAEKFLAYNSLKAE